jgi:hypothetical protein
MWHGHSGHDGHGRDAPATAGGVRMDISRLLVPHPAFPARASNPDLPLFSSTSFHATYNSFIFINIVSRLKMDIFSTFVLNNILLLSFNLDISFFPRPCSPKIE